MTVCDVNVTSATQRGSGRSTLNVLSPFSSFSSPLPPATRMEYLQARLDSFASSKSKRTKASTSKHSSASTKWPHPPTWKATPTSLAEAGFYHDPSSSSPDNVTCFMCKKSLCGWEPEDDPFEIHYEKCSEMCGWAVVRCQKPDTNGKYASSRNG